MIPTVQSPKRLLRFVSFGLVFGLIGGCISAQQMQPVAQAGLEASILAGQATASVRADLASYREAEFIAAALGAGSDLDTIEKSAAKMDEIRRLLFARQVMFGELEKMYRTLKGLADYDASAEIDGVVGGAASAVLSYANEARGASVPASESVASIIDAAAKSIISGVQQRKLARANQGLAKLNDAIVTQLKWEQASRIAIAELQKVTKQNILIGMVKNRLGRSHSLLAGHAASLGLDYDPAQFIRVYEEKRKNDTAGFSFMQAMLVRAHLANLDRRLKVESDVLDAAIKALIGLANAHRRLEKESKRLDLAEATAIVAQLRIVASEAATIAAEVKAARAEARAGRDQQQQALTQIVLKAVAAHLGIELPSTD